MARVTKEHLSGCWLWTGDRSTRGGYGRIGEGGRGARQRLVLTHRASYECNVGPIPDGMNVLHRCDNPACCNPEHLFLGTLSDNVQDCLTKGRHVTKRGEQNGQAKLTRTAVRVIRANTLNKTTSAFAREYGVSRRAVRFAATGATWK